MVGMEKQNFTMSMPKDLLRRAKIQAAKEDKTLSKFIREALEEKIREDSGYKRARKKHQKILSSGFNMGTKGNLRLSRDEIHERN